MRCVVIAYVCLGRSELSTAKFMFAEWDSRYLMLVFCVFACGRANPLDDYNNGCGLALLCDGDDDLDDDDDD